MKNRLVHIIGIVLATAALSACNKPTGDANNTATTTGPMGPASAASR